MENAALSVRNLTKEYVRGKPVLRGISLDFAGSGFTAIIGPSGTSSSRSCHWAPSPTAVRCAALSTGLVSTRCGATRTPGSAARKARRNSGRLRPDAGDRFFSLAMACALLASAARWSNVSPTTLTAPPSGRTSAAPSPPDTNSIPLVPATASIIEPHGICHISSGA